MLRIPKGYDSISKTFRLPVDLVADMEKIACDHKISLNKLVVQCLQYAVEHVETPEEDPVNAPDKTTDKTVLMGK